MSISSCFENTIDWACSEYMEQLYNLSLENLSPSFSIKPIKEIGRCLFLAGVPFVGYHACAYPQFKTAFTIATSVYVAFKTRDFLLTCSATFGKLKLMKAMLFLGADVNKNGCPLDDFTPLHCAARSSHNEAIKILLQNGADTNKALEGGKSGFDYPETPINWIVQEGNISGFDIIEQHMINKGLSLDYSVLFAIAKDSYKKNPDLISKLQSKLQSKQSLIE